MSLYSYGCSFSNKNKDYLGTQNSAKPAIARLWGGLERLHPAWVNQHATGKMFYAAHIKKTV
jgi:hypothetical protein